MTFMCRNLYIKEEIFNWKRDVIYMLMSLRGRGKSQGERQFLVTQKNNNYFNVNVTQNLIQAC